MNPIISLDPEFSARFVMTLAHFLWQGAAIGLAVFLLGFILRRASSRLRYGIFLTALLAMALCPPVTYSLLEPVVLDSGTPAAAALPASQPGTTYPIDQPDLTDPRHRTDPSDPSDPLALADADAASEDRTVAAAPPADFESAAPELTASTPATTDWHTYTPYLIMAYLAGVLVMLARLALGLAGGGRLRKRAQYITDNTTLDALQRQAAQLRLRAVPVVAYCQRVAVPTVVGVIRPMILLPASLATGMPPQQVELLLLHELAHIRRYDHVINIAQRLVEAALFFHPALWYVSHRIRVEREHCCDDLVIALGGERQAYAESLVAAAALATGARLSPAAVAATGKPSQLRRRIHRLLGDPQPPVRLVRGGWVLTALVAVALIAGATQLATPTPEEPVAEDSLDLTAKPVDASEETVPESELGLAQAAESEEQEAAPSEEFSEESLLRKTDPEEVQKEQEILREFNELWPQLEDPDWWLRKVAVQQIGELPQRPYVVEHLITMLKDEDARVQAAAAEALAKQGDPKAIKHLVAALKEESEVREAAAEALTHFGPDDVMPLLTLAARDEDESVCRGAVVGLAKQNTMDAAMVLVDLFPECYAESATGTRRARVPVRRANQWLGTLILGQTAQAIVDALDSMDFEIAHAAMSRALSTGTWEGRTIAAMVLGETELDKDESLQRTLQTFLQEDRKDLRAAAVHVFWGIIIDQNEAGQAPDPEIVAALVPVIRDFNRGIAHNATIALTTANWQPSTVEERARFLVAAGRSQEAAELGSVAFEPMQHALQSDLTPAFSISGNTIGFPRDVFEGLRQIDDPRRANALIDALRIAPAEWTEWIAASLGETGDPIAVDTLLPMLDHLNDDVRKAAAHALGKIGDPRAVEPLMKHLDDNDVNVRGVVIQALGEIGDPRATPALRPLLDTDNRHSAAEALGKIGDAESVPTLLKLYIEHDSTQFVTALANIGGDQVRDGMIEMLLQNTGENRRAKAAEVLGQLRDPAAVPALNDAIHYDTHREVRNFAYQALGRIGGEEAASVLSALVSAQNHGPSFANHAAQITTALSQINNPIASDGLAEIFDKLSVNPGSSLVMTSLQAAKALAERGDPRAKAMLEELREIPETRIEATNALQELEQQSPPDAESTAPDAAAEHEPDLAVPTDRTDPSDPTDPSVAQPAAAAPQTSQLTGPRLQFRWVVEDDDAETKTVLPAPTETEPDRTLAVGDEVVLTEGDMAKAIVKQEDQGSYSVLLETTEEGAAKLEKATKENVGKTLAIVFDGQIILAPKVQSSIGKSVSITGRFTREQVEEIARAIHTSKPGAKQQAARLYGPRFQLRWVVEGDDAKGKIVLPAPTESDPDRTLAVGDEVILYGGGIVTAGVQKEPDSDRHAIRFVTNERWAKRLHDATEQNQGKRLAIIFDGRIVSTPVVQEPFGETGMITGNFSQDEADAIAKAIVGEDEQGDDEPLPEPFIYDPGYLQ